MPDIIMMLHTCWTRTGYRALLCFTLRNDYLLYECTNACFTLLLLSCFAVGVCAVVPPCTMQNINSVTLLCGIMQCMHLALFAYAMLCNIIIAVSLLLLLHCVRAIACMLLLLCGCLLCVLSVLCYEIMTKSRPHGGGYAVWAQKQLYPSDHISTKRPLFMI